MKYIWRSNTVKGQNENMSFISPKIATFCIMLTFYYTGGNITANTVIKVLSWTELLKGGVVWMFSLFVQYTMEMLASINRVEVSFQRFPTCFKSRFNITSYDFLAVLDQDSILLPMISSYFKSRFNITSKHFLPVSNQNSISLPKIF